MALDRIGTSRAAHGVINREGVEQQLDRIDLPALILVGEEDVATPKQKSELMYGGIRDSTLVVISRAGHSSTIEEPAAVNKALKEFLEL